ncbi:uncharacterized protein LOC129795934 [Lutzomyia longipalpis]|uniref:uncharacterized protein LOC129795934 n=1 Tax=Lutzomyia longipalpis TaxID=7200 RepID=UPI002483C297|nr:uncharacterized protein LOC129795934 [Lutzomyia longipalpis]
MVCEFCERSSDNTIIEDESDCFYNLLEKARKHHLDLQLKLQRMSLAYESAKNEIDILKKADKYRKKERKEKQEKSPKKFFNPGTQAVLPDNDWEDAFKTAADSVDKENSPVGKWNLRNSRIMRDLLPSSDDLFEDDQDDKVPKLPQRTKSTTKGSGWMSKKDILNETITSNRALTFEKPPMPLSRLDSIKTPSHTPTVPPVKQEKKQKMRQTTLNFSRVDADETFCEELIDATPEDRCTSFKLRDRINYQSADPSPKDKSTILCNADESILIQDSQEKEEATKEAEKPREKPENPQILHSFVTPDGFWDLGFPPTAKTQPPSPSDRLRKRPKRNS